MAIFEIGISARATWNLHSLNNEGTVGNVTEPRTVVLASGEKTDGVSGEMLKHIHAYNVWLLHEDKGDMCEACRTMHPQKADKNPLIKKKDAPEKAMKEALSSCILCDVHGFLVQRPAVARPSTVEFGWALGLPENTHRDIHIHARHSMIGRSREEVEAGAEKSADRQVTAQMIYHRPTRSGRYAIVSIFQPWRIGLNEVDYSYAVEAEKRKVRYQLALNAYKAAFMRTDGAMTSTRLPHVEAIEGVLVVSESNFPAPVISPINDDYIIRTEDIIKVQKGLSAERFSSMAELCTILDRLATEDIYTLTVAK